jgi:three-Cys-motif partner protein
MGKRVSDEEFYDQSLNFWVEHGKELRRICPECTNEYNDHSLLKLIGFTYWVGIFLPIIHKKFRKRHGYRICYIDIMAGSGVTSTKRAGDYFCGSCPGVLLSSKAKNILFDLVIAIEIDKKKAIALKKRLDFLNISSEIEVVQKDINECIEEIITKIKEERSVSYIIIDPEGYEGLFWATIEPLLKLKGDLMLNWFEHDLWRIRGAALSEAANENVKEFHIKRLNELFGGESWREAYSSSHLTDMFIVRLTSISDKNIAEVVTIPRVAGDFKLILLTNEHVKDQAKDWAKRVTERINSIHGKEISKLLDVKAGRQKSLKEFDEGT